MGIEERGTIRCTPFEGRTCVLRPAGGHARAPGPSRRRRRRSCAGHGSRAARPVSRSSARTPQHPARLVADEARSPNPGRDRRAPSRGRARDVHRVERVVLLRVVEPHGSDQRIRPKRRGRRQRGAAGQVPCARQVPGASQSVVEEQAGAHVRALPPSVREREQELHRPHEVGREPVSSRRRSRRASRTSLNSSISRYRSPPWISLLDRLEVPAARSRASISPTDRPRDTASSATADTGDPAPDDEDVEPLLLEPGDRVRAGAGLRAPVGHASART